MAEASDAFPGEKPQSLLLTYLPLEIRYKIFDALLDSHHLIIISPNGKQRGVLKPLVQVCIQLREEVQRWLDGKKKDTIIRSPAFGVFNNEVTTFKMCWFDDCTLSFPPHDFRNVGSNTYQRCYTPGHPARDLEKLEMWQRAMDLQGTNLCLSVNWALRYDPRFEGYIVGLFDEKLLRKEEEDWEVLDPEIHKKYEYLPWLPINIVWSDGFETHAEHQEYTRQHPLEGMMVRRVECGIAFEYRYDDDFNLLELD